MSSSQKCLGALDARDVISPRRSSGKIAGRFAGRFAGQRRRPGAVVVELAVLLPLLVFLFLVATDFARVFYYSLTLTNCARAGALYASDPTISSESPFASAQAAALADATNLNPQPTITQANGVDSTGRAYVEVTANHSFATITGFPGIPHTMNLQRTVRLYVAAKSPTSY